MKSIAHWVDEERKEREGKKERKRERERERERRAYISKGADKGGKNWTET